MLSQKERDGLGKILNELCTKDLLSITDTTTKRMVRVETRNEAIKAILTYTEKPSFLLRRRKIKKSDIFNYLMNVDVVVSVNGEKSDFIKACLNLWQSDDSCQNSGDYLDVRDDFDEEATEVTIVHEETTEIIPAQAPNREYSNAFCEEMGHQFSKWFFQSLNGVTGFGPQHFWPDCKLWFSNKENTLYVTDANQVAAYLLNFIVNDGLFFHPNISGEAIKCEQEQHGLVKIAVSGVVHKQNNCIGLFDCCFGLVKDPALNNNWKIKHIQMLIQLTKDKMTNGVIQGMANLCAINVQ